MPKQVPQAELDAVERVVASFPDGASIDEISDALDLQLPHRTLQRRLALLIQKERLTVKGRGRGILYRLVPASEKPVANAEIEAGVGARDESRISISPEGETIRQLVGQAIQSRRPVGYMRAFLDSYRPNETFYLSLETRQHLLKLGQARGGVRPAGTYARAILNRLLIDLSWNSSRLEGNTYSLLETERLLESGETADGKGALDAQMILNHKAAIELLVGQASEIGFNRYTICNLHALLSDNLLADAQACGRVRSNAVGITGTVFTPLEGPQVIEDCFQQVLTSCEAIEDAFEQALFIMVHLPYLQPFEDVNKRVSRLAANIPLIRRNLCPLSFVDVPEKVYTAGMLGIYELNRVELLRDVFVWAYERSCARYSAVRQSLGQPDPFRMRYKPLLDEVVGEVVRGRLGKSAAGALIRRHADEKILAEDRMRFSELAETELMALHEGNIARYRLRPSEYRAWRETWR